MFTVIAADGTHLLTTNCLVAARDLMRSSQNSTIQYGRAAIASAAVAQKRPYADPMPEDLSEQVDYALPEVPCNKAIDSAIA